MKGTHELTESSLKRLNNHRCLSDQKRDHME